MKTVFRQLIFLATLSLLTIWLTTTTVPMYENRNGVYRAYLYGPITIMSHITLINTLDRAKSGETVWVYVKSRGGVAWHMRHIIKAVKNSRATVRMVVDGYAYSAAAQIIMYGKYIHLTEDDLIMFHQCHSGNSEIKLSDRALKSCTQGLREAVKEILTDKEWHEMIWHGGEVWFTGDELLERLDKAAR